MKHTLVIGGTTTSYPAAKWRHPFNGTRMIPCLTESLPWLQAWGLFHVNNSTSILEDTKVKTAAPLHIDGHQILLEFKIECRLSRWLTRDEISAGVIQAILGYTAFLYSKRNSPFETLLVLDLA